MTNMTIRLGFAVLFLISIFTSSDRAQAFMESLTIVGQSAKTADAQTPAFYDMGRMMGSRFSYALSDGFSGWRGHRIALVIGNSRYAVAPLSNPRNDAKAVADIFRNVKFNEVVEAHDVTTAEMTAILAEFKKRAAQADWAVVYYAGHGVEMNGNNHLISVDAKLVSEQDLQQSSVSLSSVMNSVEGTRKLGLIILDACRNNPFLETLQEGRAVSRSQGGASHAAPISPGLGAVTPPVGVMVAYASRHGTTALEGEGQEHSPYTAALLSILGERGVEISDVFRRVRDQVFKASGGQQQPYTYGSLPAESFYFY